jgi:metal-responsive CopG/Arc/MetJ family transcriptional regulator
MVVARTQTLVQLTDELVAALDERAARRGVSRSRVIREALDAYLKSDRDAEIDAAIIEGYTQVPPPNRDPWAEAAGRRSIEAEPW